VGLEPRLARALAKSTKSSGLARAPFLAARYTTKLMTFEGVTSQESREETKEGRGQCWVESMTRPSQTRVFWRFMREKEKARINSQGLESQSFKESFTSLRKSV
jgi:hypothetical protein